MMNSLEILRSWFPDYSEEKLQELDDSLNKQKEAFQSSTGTRFPLEEFVNSLKQFSAEPDQVSKIIDTLSINVNKSSTPPPLSPKEYGLSLKRNQLNRK